MEVVVKVSSSIVPLHPAVAVGLPGKPGVEVVVRVVALRGLPHGGRGQEEADSQRINVIRDIFNI